MLQRLSPIFCLVLLLATGLMAQRAAQDIGNTASQQEEQRNASGKKMLILDPTATKVTFLAGTTLGDVTGHFGMESGVIRWDVKTGKAGGLIVIDAVSGGTGSTWEDHILHGEVLQSVQYTRITYQPTKVTGALIREGSAMFHMDGILHLLNADHPLHMDITVEAAGSQLWAATHVVLPYADWGLTDPSFWFIHADKTVSLDISTTGTVQNEAPPQPLL